MKPTKKKTVACPAALRLEAMLPVDAGILSQQADDWTDRSVERGTVGPLAAEHALWHNCLFRNVTFTDCRLHGAQLSDIRFEGCDLSNLALDGAALNRVEFVGCKLLGAALPDATLNHVRLERCNGRYLNLSGSRLRQVRFTECDLTEAALNDCRLDGVAFEGGKGDNFDLKLGSGQFVPGFEEQIVGMSAGEEKDIDITFPEDYHKELAGKAVVFHVKLNKVTETIVPEQDDEFAKDVSEFDTLDELKADIRAKALENAKKQADSAFEQAAVDKAAENTTVDMPKALVENELDIQMERFGYQLQMSGYSMEQYAKMMGGDLSTMRKALRPSAEKQAKVDVTLGEIVKVENLEVTDEEVEAEYQSLADTYHMELEKVRGLVEAESLKQDLLTRKAVKLIAEAAVPVAPKPEEETKTEE